MGTMVVQGLDLHFKAGATGNAVWAATIYFFTVWAKSSILNKPQQYIESVHSEPGPLLDLCTGD